MKTISINVKLTSSGKTEGEAIERITRELEEIVGDIGIGVVESAGGGDYVDSKHWKLEGDLST